MIPYVEHPSIALGPVTVHAFGVFVALAIVIGLGLLRRRLRRQGLDPTVGERLAWYAVTSGFVGAHLFSTLFYFPEDVVANPLILLKLWANLSSFGGMVGGAFGIWLFMTLKAPSLDARTKWRYLDATVFAFTFALAVGRIACTFAHDHPGTTTSFPLAISLESLEARQYVTYVYAEAGRLKELLPAGELATKGFHDLGWYEFLYLAVIMLPVTLLLGREPRMDGTHLIAFILLYAPVRFALDFLRVNDARYMHLTPAQWTALAGVLALPLLVMRIRSYPAPPVPCGELKRYDR